ncbi:9208_t:CDS:2, partial [Funneliformis caledonium]
ALGPQAGGSEGPGSSDRGVHRSLGGLKVRYTEGGLNHETGRKRKERIACIFAIEQRQFHPQTGYFSLMQAIASFLSTSVHQVLVEYLTLFPLMGSKRLNYQDWARVHLMIVAKQHLTHLDAFYSELNQQGTYNQEDKEAKPTFSLPSKPCLPQNRHRPGISTDTWSQTKGRVSCEFRLEQRQVHLTTGQSFEPVLSAIANLLVVRLYIVQHHQPPVDYVLCSDSIWNPLLFCKNPEGHLMHFDPCLAFPEEAVLTLSSPRYGALRIVSEASKSKKTSTEGSKEFPAYSNVRVLKEHKGSGNLPCSTKLLASSSPNAGGTTGAWTRGRPAVLRPPRPEDQGPSVLPGLRTKGPQSLGRGWAEGDLGVFESFWPILQMGYRIEENPKTFLQGAEGASASTEGVRFSFFPWGDKQGIESTENTQQGPKKD